MKKCFYFFLCLLIPTLPLSAERKKVGVVLGGGGAKGVAHIGVLKVLEEAEIPIDYIVGTSMGSIVGGFYSIGYTAHEIDSMVRMQDWTMLLSDRIDRNNLTFPQKENSERFIISLPFGKGSSDQVSGGVIKGQNLQKLFANLTIGYHDEVDFDSLYIPFSCVALDLVSGDDYVFRNGSLPIAMRASMAIPAVFTPVRLDSMVLVDGGITNNYPANVAKDMGADIIIGVDLGTSDLKLLEGINTPGDVVGQIIALYGYDRYTDNKENTDLLIRPDMTPYNSASFHPAAIDTLIKRGEEEARRHWDEILKLKEEVLSSGFPSATTNKKTPSGPPKPSDSFNLASITFRGAEQRDEKWLLKLSGLRENSTISLLKLENAISVLMGTNAYSHVSYKLNGNDPYDLELVLQQKSTTSANLGLRYDTEEGIALLLNATLDYNRVARSKFALTGRVAKSSYVRFDYTLERNPLRNINLFYMFNYQDLDMFERGKKIFNTSYQHHLAELAFSDMSWLNFKVRMGLRHEYFNYNSFLFRGGGQDRNVKPEGFVNYFVSAHLETFDRRYFPNKGISLQAHYTMYTDNFVSYNGTSPFFAVGGEFSAAIRLRSHLTLLPSVYGRVLIGGNLAYPYLNVVGGEYAGKYIPQQLPFAGINHMEIFDNSVAVVRFNLRQRIFGRNYLSLIGNYGVHNDDFFDLLNSKHIWGASLGYAYNSLAGPLNTNLGISNWNKRVVFYLNLGYYF